MRAGEPLSIHEGCPGLGKRPSPPAQELVFRLEDPLDHPNRDVVPMEDHTNPTQNLD